MVAFDMQKTLILLVLLACDPDVTEPPCVSTTGTVCHAAEVLAYEHCECLGLNGEETLQCMYPVMATLCDDHDCSANYTRWEQLNACTVARVCNDECGL